VWKKQRASGRFALLKDYDICAWSGVLGPKKQEGDRQAPEGFYTIRPAQMNPDSNYYLAFNMGYPNTFDQSLGRTGSELMVHGACSSRGCYSMTDENIQEIYTLGRLAFQGGQREFQVQAYPFRMTPANLARHRNDPNMPFWLMIKEGYDHFEVTGQPPKVDVCEHRYIFDAVAEKGGFSPAGKCPAMSMPESLRAAVEKKETRDNAKMLLIAERLDRRENSAGAESMKLALATPSTAERSAPMSVATGALPSVETAAVQPTSVQPTAPQPTTTSVATVSSPAVPTPRPNRRTAVASASAAPAPKPAPAPADTSANVLPVPDMSADAPAAAPQPAPQMASSGDRTSSKKKLLSAEETKALQDRMLVESAPTDPNVTNAYAEAQQDDGGLTGFVLRLMKQQ
jgi:murein L,D-transpeptidase YafK